MAYENYPYVECGAIGHAWYIGETHWVPEFGRPVTLRCERCGSERREAWSDMSGILLNRHYDHPDGYRIGKGRPSRSDFRAMLLARLNPSGVRPRARKRAAPVVRRKARR